MEERESFVKLISGLGETSTFHGIPKIVTSRQRVVKVLWCLLLLGAMALFSIQLYELCEEYYSFPTKTSVKMKFAPLPFPALTFCNMNPFKSTDVPEFSHLWDIYVQFWMAETDATFLYPEVDTPAVAEKNENTREKFNAWRNRVLTGIQNISKQERIMSGHQAKEFILSVSFGGHYISPEIFSVTSSHLYGNCFTLDTESMVARGGGYDYSLYVVFNVEKSKYLYGVSSSYGVRLVLHEKGTYPLPAMEGITLSTNYETHVGLRMTRLNRLGGKYGKCTNGRNMKKKYNTKYTLPLCYSVCETEHIISECGCRPLSSPEFMNVSERICDHDSDKDCFVNVKVKLLNGKINCECDRRCEEVVYTSTLSGRRWPHAEYLSNILVKEVCKRNVTLPANICGTVQRTWPAELTQEQIGLVSDNFLAVYIYFEDLNFEEIKEEPLYNTVRFLSDIGGAMGLYIGASALTCVEILQLLLEVILFYRRQRLTSAREINTEGR